MANTNKKIFSASERRDRLFELSDVLGRLEKLKKENGITEKEFYYMERERIENKESLEKDIKETKEVISKKLAELYSLGVYFYTWKDTKAVKSGSDSDYKYRIRYDVYGKKVVSVEKYSRHKYPKTDHYSHYVSNGEIPETEYSKFEGYFTDDFTGEIDYQRMWNGIEYIEKKVYALSFDQLLHSEFPDDLLYNRYNIFIPDDIDFNVISTSLMEPLAKFINSTIELEDLNSGIVERKLCELYGHDLEVSHIDYKYPVEIDGYKEPGDEYSYKRTINVVRVQCRCKCCGYKGDIGEFISQWHSALLRGKVFKEPKIHIDN